MHPEISFLGKTIPSYWVCALLGALTCYVAAFFRRKQFRELQNVDITNSAALIAIGVVLGSRLLYLITIIPIIARNFQYLCNHLSIAYSIVSNGMVFYGGLFGAIFVLHRYTRRYGLDELGFFDFYAPFFPLFHAFGRVGCFMTGCCHGIVSEKYGIAFLNSTSSENGIPYFPVQLLSCFANLCLFLILLVYDKKPHRKGITFSLYLFLYAIGRFFIEFLRGDSVRGIYGGLSTSQWISLALLIIMLIKAVATRRRTLNVSSTD